MTLQEIEEKKTYLNSLRPFTNEEINIINSNLIKYNVSENQSIWELKGIKKSL